MKKIKMFKLTLVLPCYNEEENIDTLFKNFYDCIENLNDTCILFLDNGSTDNSLIKIKENINLYHTPNFSYMSLKQNKGYGYGLKIALSNITTPYIGISHADLQIPAEETINIAKSFLESDKNSLYMGKRKGRSVLDKFFTKGMLFIVFLFTGNIFKDINAQPKYFENSKEFYFDNFPNDFNFDLHLLLKIKKMSKLINYYEIDFLERKAGIAKGGGSFKGKIKLTLSTLRYLIGKKIDYENIV